MIAPENAASVRVAMKCGFRFWQDARYQSGPVLLYIRGVSDHE
jgi:RimJ/RimL family protein N-acetyltransferase